MLLLGNADLRASFDFMRFDTPRTCPVTASDLLDPVVLTDSDLEAFF